LRSWIQKPGTRAFITNQSLDLVCLNETKLQEKHIPEISLLLPEYRYQFWTCSTKKLGYSGVSILSKVKPLSVSYNLPGHPEEGRLIQADFESFSLVATYVPNSMSRFEYRVQEWDRDLRAYLEKLKETRNVVWIGDLNVINLDIDVYRLEGNEDCAGGTREERASFHETLTRGFCDCFRELHPTERKYSWFNVKRKTAKERNEGWRFDMAVVSAQMMAKVKDCLIFDDVAGSDHYPIKLILENSVQ
jgi:exodeoxyribonuclease-3